MKWKELFVTIWSCLLVVLVSSDEFDVDKALKFHNNLIKKFTDCVDVRLKEDGTFGLFATKEIQQYKPILKIPADQIAFAWDEYPRSYFFWEMVRGTPQDRLMGRLLIEKYVNKIGIFYSYYIKNQNPSWFNDTFPNWDQDDWDEFGERLAFQGTNMTWQHTLREQFKKILYLNEPYKKEYDPHFPDEMITDKAFREMYSIVVKRGLPVSKWAWFILKGIDPNTYRRGGGAIQYENKHLWENEDGFMLVPFADLIAHEKIPLNHTYKVKDQLNTTKNETIALLNNTGISEDEVYVVDSSFDNFRLFDEMVFEHSYPFDISNFYGLTKNSLHLLANHDYLPDEEIKYQRGRFTNFHNVENYGHVVRKNNFEHFSLYLDPNSLYLRDSIIDYCHKIDCVDPHLNNNSKYFEFRFHRNQVSHHFVHFLRLVTFNYSFPDSFNTTAADNVMARGYFNNPWMEIFTWKSYFWKIDFRQSWWTSLRRDLNDMDLYIANNTQIENNQYMKYIQLAIDQKQIVYKHLNYAYSKYIRTFHNAIMRKEVKNRILDIMHHPEDPYRAMMLIKPYDE